jgi:hypothetical protein
MVDQSDVFFSGKTIFLENNIDFNNAEIGVTKVWNSENPATFDGCNKTVSNFKINRPSNDEVALFTGTLDIKNLNIDNAQIAGSRSVGVLGGWLYGNIDNCHVSNSTVVSYFWMAGGLAGQYGSGNITNSSVTKLTITCPGGVGVFVGNLNENGNRTIANCSISQCSVNQNATLGDVYDSMFGVVVGVIWPENTSYYFNDITMENNTIKNSPSTTIIGLVENCDIYLDGNKSVAGYPNLFKNSAGEYLLVSKESLADWNKFLLANYDRAFNNTYKLLNDIDAAGLVWACNVTFNHNSSFANGMVFDGNGKTISNLTIASNGMFQGATRSGNGTPMIAKDLTFDNVTVAGNWFGGVIWGDMYGPATFENVTIKNSSVTATCNVGAFVGGTCEPNHLTATFKGCSVENCTLTANGAAGQDPNGASGFVGRAFADTYLVFEGANSVDEATVLNNNNGLVGGRVYGYTAWANGGFSGTGASDDFVNWNGLN